MLDLIITVPLMLIIIAPLGFYTGEWLSKGLIQLFDVSGPVAGGLLAGYNLITPVVITNYTDFSNIDVVSSGIVDNSQPLLEVN